MEIPLGYARIYFLVIWNQWAYSKLFWIYNSAGAEQSCTNKWAAAGQNQQNHVCPAKTQINELILSCSEYIILPGQSSLVLTNQLRCDKTNKLTCVPSEDSDQPVHPPSLIRVFTVCMKKPWVFSYPLSAPRRLWSDWADAQADLSLSWAHRTFCWFCHDVAQMPFMQGPKLSLGYACV